MFWQRETAPNYDLAVDKFICSNSVIVSFDFNHVLICVNACFFLSISLFLFLFIFFPNFLVSFPFYLLFEFTRRYLHNCSNWNCSILTKCDQSWSEKSRKLERENGTNKKTQRQNESIFSGLVWCAAHKMPPVKIIIWQLSVTVSTIGPIYRTFCRKRA